MSTLTADQVRGLLAQYAFYSDPFMLLWQNHGVTPPEMARASGTPLSTIVQALGRDQGWGDQYLWNTPIVVGSTAYTVTAGGVVVYANDPAANNRPSLYNGRPYDVFNDAGTKIGSGTLSGFQDGSFMSDWAPFVMVAAGFAAGIFGPGVAATATGGEGAATGAATFNAAADSQLANAAIEAAGGDALAGYTAAGIPSAVTIDGTLYTFGAGGSLTAASSAASTLAQAGSAVKTAGAIATTLAGVTRAITGTRPTAPTVTTTPGTTPLAPGQAPAAGGSLGLLLAVVGAALALQG